MTTLSILLGFHHDRWRYVNPDRFWAGAAIAVAGSCLLAFNRFGGLIVQAPRSFVRFALIGVWGWVLMSLAIWVIARLAQDRLGTDPAYSMPRRNDEVLFTDLVAQAPAADDDDRDGPEEAQSRSSLVGALTAVGFAHQPVIYLGALIVAFSGLAQINGPGLVVALLTFALWLPALLTVAVRHTFRLSVAVSAAVVALPYLVWALVIGRHFVSQLSHVL